MPAPEAARANVCDVESSQRDGGVRNGFIANRVEL
jgi:hypothetical protein